MSESENNVIPFKKPSEENIKCSFCGTKKSVAKKMLYGQNGHAICDKCIVIATARLKEEN